MRPAPPTPKGRAAPANPQGRFAHWRREAWDDGWEGEPEEPAGAEPATEVREEWARSIVSRNRSPDVPLGQTINPYRGCEHGCIYCYARPSHAYLDLSPGLDFERLLTAKVNAPELLERELRSPRYRCRPLGIGLNTDAYQPVEREWRLTRRLIELLAAYRHPFMTVTKSALIERDLDLLAPLAELGLVSVCISLTTLDRHLARRLEPRAAAPQRRLETVRRLAAAGVPVGLLISPIIPGLTDDETEALLEAGAAAGARRARYQLVRLPHEVGPLFEAWLERHAPLKKGRVLSLIRQVHGGEVDDRRFGRRMSGSGTFARLYARRFQLAARRLGLEGEPPPLRSELFRVPTAAGDQLPLF